MGKEELGTFWFFSEDHALARLNNFWQTEKTHWADWKVLQRPFLSRLKRQKSELWIWSCSIASRDHLLSISSSWQLYEQQGTQLNVFHVLWNKLHSTSHCSKCQVCKIKQGLRYPPDHSTFCISNTVHSSVPHQATHDWIHCTLQHAAK